MASSVDSLAKDDPDLILAREQFEEYVAGTENARKVMEKCRDYRDGNQYTAEERAVYKKRKQPCITDNKIQDKCDTLLGIEKQMRTDPKAFPRTPGKEEAAEAATDSLRYIADASDFNRTVRNPAVDNLMVEGVCVGQVVVEKKKGREPKICMEHIREDRSYYDIRALRADFEDKKYCGYFRWDDVKDVEREFPGRTEQIEGCETAPNGGESTNSHEDKPISYFTKVRSRKRIQVFKHFMLKDGIWHEGVWCYGGWLDDLKPCAYKDQYGEPSCCLEIQSLYRDSDGSPYGLVQRYLDLQDEHNKRRSKMLHLLSAKRIIVRKGELEDLAKVRTELHKPDGVVEVTGDVDQLRIEDNLNEAQGQWQLLQQTDMALSQTGPNAALLGQSGTISGRAKQLDQQSGSLLVSPLYDALDSWETRMYRQAWSRVRQFWTAQMWIRVTDDERNVKFVALNEKVLKAHEAAAALKQQDLPPDQKAAQVHQIAQDPSMQQPVLDADGKQKLRNNVADMDIDIIIDRTQDTVNVQQEQFEILAQLADKRPEVPFEALVDMSQLRADTKKRIADKMSGADNPAAQQMAAMQAQMQQIELQLKQMQIEKLRSEVLKNTESAAETHIDSAVKVATFTSGEDNPASQSAGKPASKTQVSVN